MGPGTEGCKPGIPERQTQCSKTPIPDSCFSDASGVNSLNIHMKCIYVHSLTKSESTLLIFLTFGGRIPSVAGVADWQQPAVEFQCSCGNSNGTPKCHVESFLRNVLIMRMPYLVAILVCVGCGEAEISDLNSFEDLHSATGRVTFQGQPLVGGSVRLFPVAGQSAEAKGEVYTAVVSADGSFELQTFRSAGRGMGVPAGEYFASFSWSGHPDDTADLSADELPQKLPVKLTRPQTSGVRIAVASGGTVVPDIELK